MGGFSVELNTNLKYHPIRYQSIKAHTLAAPHWYSAIGEKGPTDGGNIHQAMG